MDDLHTKIQKLKKEKNAVILAHYYVPDEVQAEADYIGDSYYLAKTAAKTDADMIVFCGVNFMGESAKILSPDKTVLMPDLRADCPMAHMITEKKIKEVRERYDDLAVVCYINSTAKIKTFSDICVTSSNAVNIVKKLPNKNIFFIPDGNLGQYVKEQVTEKNIILNNGYCPTHNAMKLSELKQLKKDHPNAKVLTHPECRKEILELSDYIGSTSGIIACAERMEDKEFIVCTEQGVGYELKKRCPDKKFYFAERGFVCPNMKMNTLEKLYACMENNSGAVEVDEELRIKSLIPLNRMLELGD